MATAKLTLDTRSVKKDGTYPIKLYISHRGEDFFVSTNISVRLDDWKGKEKEPTRSKSLNSVLNQMLVQTQAHIYKLRADGKLASMDKHTLRKILSSNSFEEIDTTPEYLTILIADYFRDFIGSKHREGTRSVYEQTLAKIGKYYNLSVLTFEDINLLWLREFERKLIEGGLSINTISIHFRNLRAIFNNAIDEEKIEQNLYPFRKFKIKSERTQKRSLTVEQLRTLRDYNCQEHQRKYRDMFMLMFYLLGINSVDLFALKEVNNGRIEFRRAKTGRLYSIKVEPEALAIINRYRGNEHILDVLDNYVNYKDFLHRMNKNLQEIGPMELVPNRAKNPLFVKKNKKQVTSLFPELTTYWARHTWATIAAGLDIPKETIAAALGHGGNSVTDIYIDFDRKKIDAANRRVISAIKIKRPLNSLTKRGD